MIILSDFDLQLIGEGTHDRLYEKLGAHVLDLNGSFGTHFAVWAPNAREISVVGDFNEWNPGANPLSRTGVTGVWSGFVRRDRPRARSTSTRSSPPTAVRGSTGPTPVPSPPSYPPGPLRRSGISRDYEWGDADWMTHRAARQSLTAPITIYEVHLGSWMRVPDQGNRAADLP